MKKILLTGVNGQVGHALAAQLQQQPIAQVQLISCTRQQLDLSQPAHIRQVIRQVKPDLIINPAAYTAVDQAETEQELSFAINATAPQVIAEEAARLNAALIHFSTDYVYDGSKATAYLETDAVNPVSVYGASKLAGEQAIAAVGLPHLILRTSWVYGSYGKNFLKTIIRLAQSREQLRIVADQHGAPTADIAIAEAVAQLIERWHPHNAEQTGIYHLVNRGETTWYGFASEIVAQYQALALQQGWPALLLKELQAISSAEYPTPARRPQNSRLVSDKLEQVFGVRLPVWDKSLVTVMPALSALEN